ALSLGDPPQRVAPCAPVWTTIAVSVGGWSSRSVERRLNPAREMPFALFMAGMAVVAVAGFVRF
ncbi:MAG: hypothetical protein ACXVHK_29755, partial [Solirubrobacteraceae bacterium]